MVEAWCVKCRKKVEISNAQQVRMKSGLLAAKGTCPFCGTNVFRIIGKG